MEAVEVVVEVLSEVVVVIEVVTVDVEVTVEVVMVNSREEITTVKVVMEVVLQVDTVVLHLLHRRTELLHPNHLTTHTEVPQALQPINHNHLVDTDNPNNQATTALVVNKATADNNKATVKVNNKVTDRVSNNKATARVNNRVTAVHHNSQQLQRLQVTLKDTVSNNRTEQAPEDRMDINKQGDLIKSIRDEQFYLCRTYST